MVKEEKYCRICKGTLNSVLDFGEIYSSGFVRTQENLIKAPLVLAKCSDCGLVQLKYTVNLDSMFKQYWYRSGLNKSMVRDLQDIIKDIESEINLYNDDAVIDIGTNDGTLLTLYSNKEIVKIGFDPANNLMEDAQKNCNYFINDYFHAGKFSKKHQAKIITAIAMFYDLPDPNKFLKDVYISLKDDGIFVIQLTDLTSMLKVNAVDNLCFEHLEYYTLRDLVNLFYSNGFYIYKVSYNKVNGGSIRVFAKKLLGTGYTVKQSLYKALADEEDFLRNYGSLENLIYKTKEIRNKVLNFIGHLDYEICALGASTKGNTLLQLFKLDYTKIIAIGEINKDKFGLYTVGTNIPIVTEERILEINPNVIIILPWHFIDTFTEKLKGYLEKGGMVLFPLPEPYVLTENGGFYL